MAEQIKKDDIAEADVLANIIPTAQQLEMLNKLDIGLKGIATTLSEKLATSSKNTTFENIVKEQEAMEMLNKTYENSVNVSKQKAKVEEKMKADLEEMVPLAKETNKEWRNYTASMEENARILVGFQKQLRGVKEKMSILQKQMALKNPASAEYKKMSEELVSLTLRQEELKVSVSEANIRLKAQSKEQVAVEGSMRKTSLQLGMMRDLWRDLTDSEKKSPFGQTLLKQIKEIDSSLKHADGQIGNFQRNVGDYANGLKGAFSSFKDIGSEITNHVPQLGIFAKMFHAAGSGISEMTTATRGASKEMKILKVAIASTGIGLLVVALGSLYAWFQKTNEGSGFYAEKLKQIGNIVDVLLKLFASLWKSMAKLFTFDFKGSFDEMKTAVSGVADEMRKAVKYGKEYAEIETRLNVTAGTHAMIISNMQRGYQLARLQAEDADNSAEMRLQKAKEAQELLNKIIIAEKTRLKDEARMLEIEFQRTGLMPDMVAWQKKLAEISDVDAENGRRKIRDLKLIQNIEKEIAANKIASQSAKIQELENKHLLIRLELEIKLLEAGRSREDVNKEIAKLENDQISAKIKLLEKYNTQGKYDVQIKELKVQQLNYDVAINKQLEERKKLIADNYRELEKQEIMLNFDVMLSKLDKTAADYNVQYKKILEDRFNIEKKWIEDEIAQLDTTADDYLNKKKELDLRLIKLELDYTNNIKSIKDEKIEAKKDEKLQLDEIEKQITDGISSQIDKRISLLNKERQAKENQINYLQGLAQQGNINAKQSIAEQIEAQRELDRERERLERRKANLQAISSGLQVFSREIQAGKTPTQALTSTLTNMKLLENLLKSINFFYKGTDNAPAGVAVVDERGAELHLDKSGNIKSFGSDKGANFRHLERGDKIIPADITKNLLNQMSYATIPQINNKSDKYLFQQVAELKELKAILSQKESIATQFDEITNTLIQIQKKPNIRIVKKYRL